MAVTASIAEIWSRRIQMIHQKDLVYRAIVSFGEKQILNEGDVFHRPSLQEGTAQLYVRNSDLSIDVATTADQSITINRQPVVARYLDDLDKLQNNPSLLARMTDDSAHKIGNVIDADMLGEVSNATSSIDDSDINAATAGDPFTFNTGNTVKVFAVMARKLNALNIKQMGRFTVVSPQALQVLLEYLAGKDTALADATGLNGHVGKYMGFDLFVSNNLTASARLNFNTTPTNADALTISGITFALVSSIGTTPGNVLINGDSGTATNLAGLINAPGTTDANGVGFVTTSLREIQLKGSAVASGTTCVVTWKGESVLTVTSSNGSLPWDRETQHVLAGVKGASEAIIQSAPKLKVDSDPDRLGNIMKTWTLYGFGTFNDGRDKLVDVLLDSSNF